jgi:hypothetical protein
MVNRVRSTGILLATGGVLFILSFGPEAIGLVRPEREGQIVNFPLYAFFAVLMVVATVLLGVSLWRMRAWTSGIGRIGRVGLYLCIASVAGIGLTALTAFFSAVQTTQPPGYTFGIHFCVLRPGPPFLSYRSCSAWHGIAACGLAGAGSGTSLCCCRGHDPRLGSHGSLA